MFTNFGLILARILLTYTDKIVRIKHFLYFQVENEYGSYGCDAKYMLAMEQMLRKNLGQQVLLYTTDPIVDQALQCGSIPSLYRTVDFGAGHDVNKSFALQRKYQPKGPYVRIIFLMWLQ